MRLEHLLVALALAGCADSPREVAAPPSPTPVESPSPALSPLPETSRCENPDGGYALGTYTDDALLPPGTRFTTWLVDLDEVAQPVRPL